jgi:glycine betaine monooxygenase A
VNYAKLKHAENRQCVGDLIASRDSGHGLPRAFYHDEGVYRAEIDAIWRQGWLVAGHACQIPETGDYFIYALDGDSVIVVRGDDGGVRALHNTCRHRGTQICSTEAGHVGRFICPYHQWTYGTDGALLTARGMQEDLDRSRLGLVPAAVREVAGLVFISLADDPPSFDAAQAALEPLVDPQGLARAKVAHTIDYVVAANWKLVWENNRECYHCNANHPQYIKANFDHYNADDTSSRVQAAIDAATARSHAKWAACGLEVTHKQTGMTVFPDAERDVWFSANRTPLVEGYVSESMTGRQVAPRMGRYADVDVGTLRIRTLPNFWNHSSCDHSVSTQLAPTGLHQTSVRVTWLVDRDAREGIDYRLDELLPFWQLTSEQDWELCERAQRGINSRAFRPGPLSPYKEYNVDGFFRWYLSKLRLSGAE